MALLPRPSSWPSPDPDSRHDLGPPSRGGRPNPSRRRPGPVLRAVGAGAETEGEGDADKFELILAEFLARWDAGESPRVEDYLDALDPGRPDDLLELIYREFCLAEAAGLEPSPRDYLRRFPDRAADIEGLFGVHELLLPGRPTDDVAPAWAEGGLPLPGDSIGPYRLLRVLGEGGFARVFLAEQEDLEDRLVVLKATGRITPEPRLLARAEHPNIVPVQWHGLVDDGTLQVICMPFFGGATLADVLARRRRLRRRPTRGADLLADLDGASPPESAHRPRGGLNRDLIERLSYPRALAWVVARLAEALDFAYGKGVVHGDVKPSNALLTAEAVPMLLDFNLAVGWRPQGGRPAAGDLPDDAGGTLAYMAPERLRALAEPGLAHRPTAAERHRADIYALGVLFLELLTGRTPELTGARGSPLSLQAIASAYFVSRRQGSRVLIRSARRPVAAGLRAILERCLCPEPEGRYARAAELAEDLDRWREDRPLAFADEPSGPARLLRWARRRRRALAAVTGVALAAAAVAVGVAWASSRAHREGAARRYDQITGSKESGAFLLRRMGSGRIIDARGDPAALARRHLDHYGVFSRRDWRQHDEVRHLAPFDRDELGIFLTEQALRYAHALRLRPDSPDDWRRALIGLDRVADAPFAAVEAERRRLRDRLGLATPHVPADAAPTPEPWADAYLAGVAEEIEQARGWEVRARERYEAVLRLRPDSFWGHYRAAAAAFAVTDYPAAAAHLRFCVRARPDNPILRHQVAGCLFLSRSFAEAEEEYEKAQELDPDNPETYLARTFLWAALKQVRNFDRDRTHFLVLTGRPRAEPEEARPLDLTAPLAPAGDGRWRGLPAVFDPDEALIRFHFARAFYEGGQDALALCEAELSLASDPTRLESRYLRAVLRKRLGLPGYHDDFEQVASHPKLDAALRKPGGASLLYSFHVLTSHLINQGRARDAVELARRALALSRRHDAMPAATRLSLALALASAASEDPSLLNEAREHLQAARRLDPAAAAAEIAREPALQSLADPHE